jgi:hypothetical protein
VFFVPLITSAIYAFGSYLNDYVTRYGGYMGTNYFYYVYVGPILPFLWLVWFLPIIGIFCGEHGLYLLIKRVRNQNKSGIE